MSSTPISFLIPITNHLQGPAPRKRKLSATFAPKSDELPAIIIIRLLGFGRCIVITNPVTLASLGQIILESIDDDMRPGFRGLTGSKKPPAWTGLSDKAWGGMWDEDLWKLLKSRGEIEPFAPLVDVEVLWWFEAA